MTIKKKSLFLIFIFILFLGSYAFLNFFLKNINKYKTSIESFISNKINCELKIQGNIQIKAGLVSTIKINKFFIKNDLYIINANSINIKIKTIPILFKKFLITNIKASNGEIFIQNSNKTAKDNIEDKKLFLKKLIIKKLNLENFNFSYEDKDDNLYINLKDFFLNAGRFILIKNNKDYIKPWHKFFTNKYLKYHLKAKSIIINKYTFLNPSFNIKYYDNNVIISPLEFIFDNASVYSKFIINISKTNKTKYFLDINANNISCENLFKYFNQKSSINGILSLNAKIDFNNLSDFNKLFPSLNGDLNLSGNNLIVLDKDIDKILTAFEKSQNIDLYDIAGYYFLGPVGIFLNKSYNIFSKLPTMNKGNSEIKSFNSDWEIKEGVFLSKDVAFSTIKNLLVFDGKVNLIKNEFENFKIALLNSKYQIKAYQTVNGALNNPTLNKTYFLSNNMIVKPITDVLKKTKDLITFKKAEIFYSGKVKHPDAISR